MTALQQEASPHFSTRHKFGMSGVVSGRFEELRAGDEVNNAAGQGSEEAQGPQMGAAGIPVPR